MVSVSSFIPKNFQFNINHHEAELHQNYENFLNIEELEKIKINNEINQNKPQTVIELQNILKPVLEKNLQLQLKTNESYEKFYAKQIEQQMVSQEVNLAVKNPLLQVSYEVRTRMANWMIEVFAHFIDQSSIWTYFRAMGIFDSYLSSTKTLITDNDVHLIGIACILIASKMEDRLSISLVDLYNEAGHKQYLIPQIKIKESEILLSLQFKISFPTALKFLQRLIYKSLTEDVELLEDIKKYSIYLLKMCLHCKEILQYKASLLALTVLIFAVKIILRQLVEEQIFVKNHSVSFIARIKLQEQLLIKGILQSCFFSFEQEQFLQCYAKIKEIVETWDSKFSKYKNLNKYTHYEQEYQLFNDCQ